MTGDLPGDNLLLRPFRETTPDQVAGLFLRSAKPASEWYVGLELELFGFQRADLRSVDHPALARLLTRLAPSLGMTIEREFAVGQSVAVDVSEAVESSVDASGAVAEAEGLIVGLTGGGPLISLEPGGQIEFASSPHRALRRLLEEVRGYATALRAVGEAEGIGFWALGHHPFASRETAPKMPKGRYDIMRRYLATSGARGLDMMHLTSSVQTTVDFLSEANLVDKVRTAARVSPFLTALTASSPFSGGKANGFQSMRYQIWLGTDARRSGVWPEMFDREGLTIARYIDRAVKTPTMFFLRNGQYRVTEPKPFAAFAEEGFEGTVVTVGDFVDHLTTFFPEVRPKGYVELRGADCVLPDEAVAIAGFWRAILDDEATRRAVDDRLAKMDYEAVTKLQPQVARQGLAAESAAGPVREVAKWLVRTAYERLDAGAPDCASCLRPLVERAERGRSPADELLEQASKTSIEDALACVTL